jgi:glycogen synthase
MEVAAAKVTALTKTYGAELGTVDKWETLEGQLKNLHTPSDVEGPYNGSIELVAYVGTTSGLAFESQPDAHYLQDAVTLRILPLFRNLDSVGMDLVRFMADGSLSLSDISELQKSRTAA